MGSIFTLFILPVRVAFVVTTIASVAVMALVSVQRSEQPFNPFAPYSDLLPGQAEQVVLNREFRCQISIIPLFYKSCSLTLASGIVAEVQVIITPDTGRINKVVFKSRANRLVLGDLIALWGKPEIAVYSHMVNLRWRSLHIVAIPQIDSRHPSYWMPISLVIFDAAG
jgi:hypothetical protein